MISAIASEIFVLSMACIILLSDVFIPSPKRSYIYTLFTLAGAFFITYLTIPFVSFSVFNTSFIIDKFACGLKMFLYVVLASIFIYSRYYMQARDFLKGEFFVLTLLSLLGMMIVISSGNFLSLYLGIELFVLPIYALIVFVKDKQKYTEAAFKYFIIGSLGSGLLLYGVSLIYGATGAIDFVTIANSANTSQLFVLGMLFVISGIALEFGAVPFHMWLPDVYEGSPTTVTMIVGTIPKVAIFAIAYRLVSLAFPSITIQLQQLLLILALASIILGNVLAIVQNNLKRFLAYSTISHIGFILLALFAAPTVGFIPAIFYTLVYTVMVLAAFAIIMYLSHKGFEADGIHDFKGLHKREPWFAFLMLITMFALAGIPPLVGFYAKLQVLQAVVTAGFAWIAIVAMLFSVIGAYYYLKVIWVMYFEEPVDPLNITYTNTMSIVAKVLTSSHGLVLLAAGIYPASIIYLCMNMLM